MGNLEKNVLLAKQTKWNFKNNILSDSFILKILNITHTKKLIDSPITDDILRANI